MHWDSLAVDNEIVNTFNFFLVYVAVAETYLQELPSMIVNWFGEITKLTSLLIADQITQKLGMHFRYAHGSRYI